MHYSRTPKLARVSAKVTWEDSDRTECEVYFATEPQFADYLRPDANAYLLAAFVPALSHGEERIRVEGKLCPRLRDGVTTAMRLLKYWYPSTPAPLAIEATQGFETTAPCEHRGAACTMSGGIDSLATLRINRLQFPLDHELSIRSCFLVYGLDVGGYTSMPGAKPHFDEVKSLLTEFGESSDFTLIPVETNLRHLDESDVLFAAKWFGAAIASIGHAFAPRISTLMIPSGNSIEEQEPQGSHPLLDPSYSSSGLNVLHDGFGLSRLEKVELIAEWGKPLSILRSCYAPFRKADVINCGKCEKCLRTMTALLVHGKLDQCDTFPLDDLTARDLDALRITLPRSSLTSAERMLTDMPAIFTPHTVEMWRELIEPLERVGRSDLARVIVVKIGQYDRYHKSILKRLLRLAINYTRRAIVVADRIFLRGYLKKRWVQAKSRAQ